MPPTPPLTRRVVLSAVLAAAGAAGLTSCASATRTPPEIPVAEEPTTSDIDSAATTVTPKPVVLFIGNSFTGGSAMDSGPDSEWPALVGASLGLSVVVASDGSSGYAVAGDDGESYGTLALGTPSDAALVVFLGSDNDEVAAAGDVFAAAADSFATAIAQAPQAAVLAISTFWVSDDVPTGMLDARDAVEEAADAAGVPFVDALTARWIVDDAAELIGADGLHPTDTGHAVLADLIAPYVLAMLQNGSIDSVD